MNAFAKNEYQNFNIAIITYYIALYEKYIIIISKGQKESFKEIKFVFLKVLLQ